MAPTPRAGTNSWPISKVGSTPAVDTVPTLTVPSDEVWELQALEVTLATDANAVDRDLNILITDSAGVELSSGPVDGTSIIEDLTVLYHLAQYQTAPTDTTTNHYDILPQRMQDLIIPPGAIITIVVTNLQAADQFTAITALVKKFSVTL